MKVTIIAKIRETCTCSSSPCAVSVSVVCTLVEMLVLGSSVQQSSKVNHFGRIDIQLSTKQQVSLVSTLAKWPLATTTQNTTQTTTQNTTHNNNQMSCCHPTPQQLCPLTSWVGQRGPQHMVPWHPMVPCQAPVVWFRGATPLVGLFGGHKTTHIEKQRGNDALALTALPIRVQAETKNSCPIAFLQQEQHENSVKHQHNSPHKHHHHAFAPPMVSSQ